LLAVGCRLSVAGWQNGTLQPLMGALLMNMTQFAGPSQSIWKPAVGCWMLCPLTASWLSLGPNTSAINVSLLSTFLCSLGPVARQLGCLAAWLLGVLLFDLFSIQGSVSAAV